jgi:beta-phosphoglucomutase-like phosphatase (HAD superfamily)
VTGNWNVSAVLLDMDGTLLDTERVYFDSLVAALTAHGYTDDAVIILLAGDPPTLMKASMRGSSAGRRPIGAIDARSDIRCR